MATKDQILKNLREYNASEIAQAVREGTVTIYELSKTGNLSPLMRRRIEQQLAAPVAPAPSAASTASTASTATVATVAAVEEHPEPASVAQPVSEPIEKSSNQQPQQPPLFATEINRPVSGASATPPPFTQTPASAMPEMPTSEMPPSAMPEMPQTAPPVSAQVNPQADFNIVQDPVLDNSGFFRRPFSIKGRIRRTEYGISIIIINGLSFVLSKVIDDATETGLIFILLAFLALIWFQIAQSTKRCHDRGNCGWFQLIPFYGLVLLFGAGEDNTNRYGTTPY